MVFRQLSGLDSILQAGGRSNREGKRDRGYVFIFEKDTDAPSKDMRIAATKRLLEDFGDISSRECIERYYNDIFFFREKQIEDNSIAKGISHPKEIPFMIFAKSFQLIQDGSVGIVINQNADCHRLLERLKNGDKTALRGLQKFSVPLKYNGWENCGFNTALGKGIIEDCGAGVFVLNNIKYYNSETGLDVEYNDDVILG